MRLSRYENPLESATDKFPVAVYGFLHDDTGIPRQSNCIEKLNKNPLDYYYSSYNFPSEQVAIGLGAGDINADYGLGNPGLAPSHRFMVHFDLKVF